MLINNTSKVFSKMSFLNIVHKTVQVAIEPLNNWQSIRWHRKPRWVPIAKSKIFRVPTRPVVPKVEKLEMMRLFNNYRTQIKSIRRYLTAQYEIANGQAVSPELLKKAFEEDFAECNAINDAWNAEVKIGRERRVAEEIEKDVQIAKERLMERLKVREQRFLESEEFIRSQKAIAHTFITEENVDEAIEKAVNAEADYNFAINTDGVRIIGRNTKASESEVKFSVKQ